MYQFSDQCPEKYDLITAQRNMAGKITAAQYIIFQQCFSYHGSIQISVQPDLAGWSGQALFTICLQYLS